MKHRQAAGFTIIEVVVTLVVGSLFLLTIYQLAIASATVSSTSSRFTVASNLAYANLRQYADGGSADWYSCPANGTDSTTLYSSTGAVSRLPSPVTQTVVATPIFNCQTQPNLPILVVSTITYGTNGKVVHASYEGL